MAGGANVILIPEQPFDIEQVCAYVEHRFQTRYAPIVVVAEGAHPASEELAIADESWTPSATPGSAASARCWPTRSRSGPARKPAARCSATSSAAARRPRSTGCWPPGSACTRSTRCTTAFGTMVALRGTDIVRVPLAEATSELKIVPPERYAEAEVFFG